MSVPSDLFLQFFHGSKLLLRADKVNEGQGNPLTVKVPLIADDISFRCWEVAVADGGLHADVGHTSVGFSVDFRKGGEGNIQGVLPGLHGAGEVSRIPGGQVHPCLLYTSRCV